MTVVRAHLRVRASPSGGAAAAVRWDLINGLFFSALGEVVEIKLIEIFVGQRERKGKGEFPKIEQGGEW